MTADASVATAMKDADDTVLRVSGATKRFGASVALGGVDLAVGHHEVLALLGASGCGKTTLLRGIAGLTPFESGDVLIRGRSVAALAPAARDIAMVFQDGALFPHLTVTENIAVGLRARDRDRAAIGEVARLLRIDALLERRPHELSGGQRQRVGIARALVRRPALMLMDEPFAALDADLRLELRRELRRLHEIGHLSETVFVTHDQTEALGIADRIAIMAAGVVLQQGTPAELLDRPATLAVARFLGVPRISVLPARRGVVLAVRPTDLSAGVAHSQHDVDAVLIAGASEPFAGGWLVAGRAAEDAALDVVVAWADRPGVGEEFPVSCSVSRVHAFDETTGNRLDLEPAAVRAVWSEAVTR